MWKFVATAKQVLWESVELAFLVLLAVILVHLLLGGAGGEYVTSVADNVSKFAAAGSSGLLGIVIVLAIVYLVLRRTSWSHSEPAAGPTAARPSTSSSKTPSPR
jgi:hypothetical protein